MTAFHGGNLWPLLEKALPGSETPLDFSVDMNPFGPPSGLRSLLEEGLDQIHCYPEPSYRIFREAAAQVEGVDPSEILSGNGTADLIHLISRWKARDGVAVIVPAFTEYERAARADGSEPVRWMLREENGAFIPPVLDKPPWLERAGLLFLCNPNNPTGTLWPQEPLLRLLHLCEESGTILVVDEAYMDLVEDGNRHSLVPRVKESDHLIVLRSLTKGFAVPGLRLGYLAASSRTIRQLNGLQPPWSVNAVAAHAGPKLLQDQQYLADSRAGLQPLRRSLWNALGGIQGLIPYPSAANFFLCRLENRNLSGSELVERLKNRGILIRTCDDFTGLAAGRFIRTAVRRMEENERLVASLKEALPG